MATPPRGFQTVRDEYTAMRWAQRQLIVEALLEAGFLPGTATPSADEDSDTPVVLRRGGRGKTNYTSRRTIHPYDLSNWMWVEARRGNTTALISLQSQDIDPNSGNHHALLDRIGLQIYPSDPLLVTEGSSERKNISTKFDLPLSPDDLHQLVSLVSKQLQSV